MNEREDQFEQGFEQDVAAGGTGAVPARGVPDAPGHGGRAVEYESHQPDERVEVVGRRKRRTSLAARGEPLVWLTGGAASLAILMIVGLVVLVCAYGFSTFWPSPVARVTYATTPGGDTTATLLGDSFRADASPEVVSDYDYDGDGEISSTSYVDKTLWRVGNKEFGAPFAWTTDADVREIEYPEWAIVAERDEGGRAYGIIEAVSIDGRLIEGAEPAWTAFQEVFPKVRGIGKDLREVKAEIGDLKEVSEEIEQRRRALEQAGETSDSEPSASNDVAAAEDGVADVAADVNDALAELQADVEALAAREADLNGEVAAFEAELAKYRVFLRSDSGRIIAADRTRPTQTVTARRSLSGEVAGQVKSIRLIGFNDSNSRPAASGDQPMGDDSIDAEVLATARVVVPTGEGERPAVVFLDEAGSEIGRHAFAPLSVVIAADGEASASTRIAIEPAPLTVGQVVRAFPANRLGFFDKTGVYLSRWGEFLFDDPRDANQEGGVWPAIVGTVLLTFIMIVFAVPIGVIAAIYLREYASQGPLTSLVRISVNNLAGVPSIVYGVFGLGFFVYGFGGWIDSGAEGADLEPLAMGSWLLCVAIAVILVGGALALGSIASRGEKGAATDEQSKLPALFKFGAGLAWAAAAAVTFYYVIASVPPSIFPGFAAEEAARGEPFMKRGAIIWAALTLALLTLPVVIVATEEALAAVPRSMREGSYACGASKWQTIQRIVLPRALPGVMTGAILAISRGAGEVAPIMLVGALKKANEPIGGEFPFVHLNQAFMHLGFHIFDLGFQSPDAEAARSMVYTTTLLLIGIVLVLNLAAIWVRTRLRRAFAGGQF